MTEAGLHLSRLALDRLLAGGTAPAEARDHLQGCSRCRQRLERMRAADAAFVGRFPSWQALQATRRSALPRRLPLGLALAGSLAAAVVAVVVVRSTSTDQRRGGPRPALAPVSPTERSKGSSVVELAVSRNGRSFVYDGQALQPGDVLAFRTTTAHRYLLLASIERSGAVDVFFADAQGRRSAAIRSGRQVALDRGVELDDYLGRERLIALLSDAPLEVETVRRAIRARWRRLSPAAAEKLQLDRLPLAAEQLSWLIEKVPR
jgi:hypothetical protein